MARIVILGAGLTGLSTAYHLEQAGYSDYLLFEKEDTPGGLCRSVTSNGFTFDYTGHLLHSNDAATRPLVDMCVGKNNLVTATRSAWIESSGIQTPYPFQMYLHGRSPEIIAECIEGFVSRPKNRRQPHLFSEWVSSSFGAGFGKHFFYPYQRKIFSYPPRKLTATWTGRFVPKTDLSTIIRGALTPHSADNIGYNATFLYPKTGGINALITGLAKHIIRPVTTGFCATHIDTNRKRVSFANGHQEPYEYLVSTLPLDHLLTILDGTHTQSLQSASRNLLSTSVLNINLGINGGVNNPEINNAKITPSGATKTKTACNSLPNASWIYYPDAETSWYRIGFPHSFSPTACPAGTQSLYAELSYLNKPKQVPHTAFHKKGCPTPNIHTPQLAGTIKRVEENILKHFNLPHEALIARAPLMLDRAYVIYNNWRDKQVPKILHRLESEYEIHSIGRYGAWKYASMQEALVDGKTTAYALTNRFIPAHLSRDTYKTPATSIQPTNPHQNTEPETYATLPKTSIKQTETRATTSPTFVQNEVPAPTSTSTPPLSKTDKPRAIPLQHNGDEHEA